MDESAISEKHLKLWNTNAAGCWALVVTPICSSYLLYKNAQQLNQPEVMAKARNWMATGLAVWLLSVLCAIFYPLNSGLIHGFSLWYLILWYFLFVRKQASYLKQQFGENYLRYSALEWLGFIIIGLAVRIILMEFSVLILYIFHS